MSLDDVDLQCLFLDRIAVAEQDAREAAEARS